jgi:hypothetical protein
MDCWTSGVKIRLDEKSKRFFAKHSTFFPKVQRSVWVPPAHPLNPTPTPHPEIPVAADIPRWLTVKNPDGGSCFGGCPSPNRT